MERQSRYDTYYFRGIPSILPIAVGFTTLFLATLFLAACQPTNQAGNPSGTPSVDQAPTSQADNQPASIPKITPSTPSGTSALPVPQFDKIAPIGEFVSSAASGGAAPQFDQAASSAPMEQDTEAGSFLAGNYALHTSEISIAADYFTRTLAHDKTNVDLLRRSFLTLYETGQIDEAAIIARQIEAANISLPLSSEPAAAIAIMNEDWDAALVLADQMLASGGNSNLGHLVSIWSKLAKGEDTAALSDMIQFSRSLIETEAKTGTEIPSFMNLHLAHLAELSGDTKAALSYLDEIIHAPVKSAEINLSAAAAYWRLGAQDKAEALINSRLGSSFYAPKLLADMRNGTSDLVRPMTLKRAIAQSILDDSWLSTNQSNTGLFMPHAFIALRIDPDLHAARFVLAQLFVASNHTEKTKAILAEIPDSSAWAQPSLLLQITLLQNDGAYSTARERLAKVIEAWPKNSRLHHLMGDMFRWDHLYKEALGAYDTAKMLGDNSADLFRSRGICYVELGQTKPAEINLKEAIARNPNDANALNYLGYLWADEGRNLITALGYIRSAVTLRPDSGYYADSLGWVYYRMNQMDKAVLWLEKAVQLTPDDMIISEHLADAYWHARRWHEARFKWRYALELSVDDADKARLEIKLNLRNGAALPPEQN